MLNLFNSLLFLKTILIQEETEVILKRIQDHAPRSPSIGQQTLGTASIALKYLNLSSGQVAFANPFTLSLVGSASFFHKIFCMLHPPEKPDLGWLQIIGLCGGVHYFIETPIPV